MGSSCDYTWIGAAFAAFFKLGVDNIDELSKPIDDPTWLELLSLLIDLLCRVAESWAHVLVVSSEFHPLKIDE